MHYDFNWFSASTSDIHVLLLQLFLANFCALFTFDLLECETTGKNARNINDDGEVIKTT